MVKLRGFWRPTDGAKDCFIHIFHIKEACHGADRGISHELRGEVLSGLRFSNAIRGVAGGVGDFNSAFLSNFQQTIHLVTSSLPQ